MSVFFRIEKEGNTMASEPTVITPVNQKGCW